jgi:hypothetical protein
MSRLTTAGMAAKMALATLGVFGYFTEVKTGVIIDSQRQRICVRDNAERRLQNYSVPAECRIVVDELPAQLEQLKPGYSVTLTLARDRSVKKIEAHSGFGQPGRRSH